jgi:hypothetical protein
VQDVVGVTTQMDFSDIVAQPQKNSLFDISQWNCPSPVPPATYTVSGYVTNAVNNQVISGATVYLGSTQATTGSDGMYTVTGVTPGVYTLKVAATGYIAYTQTLNVTSDVNAGTYADFHLSPVLPQDTFRIVLTWGSWPSGIYSTYIVTESPSLL